MLRLLLTLLLILLILLLLRTKELQDRHWRCEQGELRGFRGARASFGDSGAQRALASEAVTASWA